MLKKKKHSTNRFDIILSARKQAIKIMKSKEQDKNINSKAASIALKKIYEEINIQKKENKKDKGA